MLNVLHRVRLKAFYAVLNGLSSDYFDETRQFLPGIEVYPFAGLVQISQALVFLALNPDQILVIWIQPADGAFFRK
jgi:hypothetical protein